MARWFRVSYESPHFVNTIIDVIANTGLNGSGTSRNVATFLGATAGGGTVLFGPYLLLDTDQSIIVNSHYGATGPADTSHQQFQIAPTSSGPWTTFVDVVVTVDAGAHWWNDVWHDLPVVAPFPLTVTATQAQTVSFQSQRCVLHTYGEFESLTYGQLEARTYGELEMTCGAGPQTYPITVTATQASALRLGRNITKTLTLSQPTSATVRRQSLRTLATLTQAQAATSIIGRGYYRTVTATQTQAVRVVKSLSLMRRLTGTNRVQTAVQIGRLVGRLLRTTQPTSPRLPKQVRLTRALTQGQNVTLAGVPVQLRVVSTVQTRSLALGRAIVLTRSIAQGTLAYLGGAFGLERTVEQATLATLERAVSRVLATRVTTAVALEWDDVTPRYEVLVTASVSQQVSLSSAGAGSTAREFVAVTRVGEFVAGSRSHAFAASRRGARFTVEVR